MGKNSCTWHPKVNGKPSKLYGDLQKITADRPQGNWLYASYLASNVGQLMDQQTLKNGKPKYKKDSLGQHDANDYLKFIDWATIQSETSSLGLLEIQVGAKDQNGNRIAYTNAKEALDKADAFNYKPDGTENHKGVVANVYKYGDVYNIVLSEKNSTTHMQPTDVKQRLQIWDIYRQVFNANNIDLDNVPQELNTTFSAYNKELIDELINLKNTQPRFLHRKDFLKLFFANSDIKAVKDLVGQGAFASLEEAAQASDDINHQTGNWTPHQRILLKNAVRESLKFQNLDLNAIKSQVKTMSLQVLNSSPEEDVRQVLHTLNKKYGIEINEIHRVNGKITALSQAAADAVMQIERKIRELEKQKGNNAEGKRLEALKDQLLRELAVGRYRKGTLEFLKEAAAQAQEIDNMLFNTPQTGSRLEKAYAMAKTIQDIQQIRDQYYLVVSALASDSLKIDEAIDKTDIDAIRKAAKDLKDFFDKKENTIYGDRGIAESVMLDLMLDLVGDTTPDGQSMANAIRMAQADSSIYDYLYSVGRASNPIIGAMGKIIRNAQDERTPLITEIARRIRRATYRLGGNSEFMYEDDGHIISDIDWVKYTDARKAAIKSFYRQGLRDFDLKQAIENWEEQNTEDRAVDVRHGNVIRWERVPNSSYRNNKATWDNVNHKMVFNPGVLTAAQQEYYDTMMQIKGEIGTLLPAYAQHQYLPPQIRRSTMDAVVKARNMKDAMKIMKTKGANLWTVREDDMDYNTNGIIDGEEYQITEGSFADTPLRQIPIFFVNKIKDQSELLLDFSSGIQALAGTAINYDAMSNIAQVVEFMGDFAKNQMARNNKAQTDMVGNKAIKVFKDLRKFGRNTNTEGLIDGFISQHIYGQKLDPEQKGYKYSKFIRNIIGYTSFKGLVTNVKGAFSNYLVGEFQMMIEAGCGEFYNIKDYAWAHSKLFGSAGVGGEIAELLTNNMRHKATLFREMFDPLNEEFSNKSHTRYYNSVFRQLLSKDCSFIGYASGEWLIHYVNMYAILHNKKVKLNGKEISLYDAFEVSNLEDGNAELVLKQGVTKLDGSQITKEWLESVKRTIRYVNQTTHGSMNEEDKGLIHQKLAGRAVMNFRQWMVEHYSRRFRKSHFDATLGENREGYWVSAWKLAKGSLISEELADLYSQEGSTAGEVFSQFMKDLTTFTIRAQTQWSNLSDHQKYNVKRVLSEVAMYFALIGLSFALGESDEHKREWWRRWWIYQVRRLMVDTEASLPLTPKIVSSATTILNSPIASVNTVNSFLYTFYGIFNGDLTAELKSGPHKGENKYWRNFKKYNLPFFKDWEQMQRLDKDETIFQVFEATPSNR